MEASLLPGLGLQGLLLRSGISAAVSSESQSGAGAGSQWDVSQDWRSGLAVSGSSGDGAAAAATLQSLHNVLVAMGTRRKEPRETLGDQND